MQILKCEKVAKVYKIAQPSW
uniref:Uncharacterized protein n=1 Tax=Arundo donax TaxID=35708 RepID=A0A0A8XNS6_ARUDO